MKKILSTLALCLVLTNSLGQFLAFDMINHSQNKLLDKYSIDFTGAHVRSMVVTGRVHRLEDKSISDSMIAAYDRFMLWNDGSFKVVPDSTVLMLGYEYLLLKPNRDEWMDFDIIPSVKILSIYNKEINQDGIKSIEIIEAIRMPYSVQSVILIEDYFGKWKIFFYDENDTTLDCPSCPAE
jgi:hypothetical protein